MLKQLAAIFRRLNSGCFKPNVGYIMLRISFPRDNIWLILRRVKPRTDEQFFLEKFSLTRFYCSCVRGKIDKFSLTRSVV